MSEIPSAWHQAQAEDHGDARIVRRRRRGSAVIILPPGSEVVTLETRGPSCRQANVAVIAAAAEREASGERIAAEKESGLRW